MDINLLVKLTSKAWSLNILAHLYSGVPGRQATLLAATSASRTSFGSSLAHLLQLGLLERNPGHGHPLRPEFRLTMQGIAIAEAASKIIEIVPDDKEFALLRRSWSVPILAVTSTPKRFSTIKSGLGKITDRALSNSLSDLEKRGWIRRQIDVSGRLPFPKYHADNAGREVNKVFALCA